MRWKEQVMEEMDKAYLDRREKLLGTIDYAVGILEDLEKNPGLINDNEHNLENIRDLFKEIQREIKSLC